ncbi:MAG: bifunctional homocysteine S-methyltransferase/methylenetetrahydrofolate reductase [Myxococcales bacterium]|nr:bifunctional homocysteine S-methyltransferase/methylenetetrahydrofolate reductase [Myxococcales bacterium]
MGYSSAVQPFLAALARGPLLFDGAMGSLLYDRGFLHTRSYEELTLTQPDVIVGVHRDYVQAGADAIETNTFGANRIALAKHGLVEKTAEINRQAVALARQAASDRAYVVGAVGPTGVRFGIASASERKLARFALAEQIDTLVVAGVDAINLETFGSILELETAIEVARERGPKVPVIAHLTFNHLGLAEGELSPAEVADRLIAAGADVVGANCIVGPGELYGVGVAMTGRGKPVIIRPNAGLPANIEGRTLYVANPEHFGVFARRMLKSGISIVGGCCGTTPAHIRTMAGAVRMMRSSDDLIARESSPAIELVSKPPATKPTMPMAERSTLGGRLARGEFVASVEITAPTGTDLTQTTAQVTALLAGGVDIINIADGPRASARMSNLAVCAELARTTGIEPILHVCCRDRNLLGLTGHLLGAHALGIRNLVIVTGDPPKLGDFPFATPVYDLDSIGLLRMVRNLNAGIDPGGKPFDGQTSYVMATGAEPGAIDYDRELRRLAEKVEAGAELIMTQPVYDPRTMERFLDDVQGWNIPVMLGVLPLASHRNAEFLHNEVPGMSIPQEIRRRMELAGTGPASRSEGVKIAQETLAAMKHRVAGVYIMPPFNRVQAALDVLTAASDRLAARTA